ncbi:MAG: hypothetical protein ACLUEQ_12315 [Cloacibacillus evryensis]
MNLFDESNSRKIFIRRHNTDGAAIIAECELCRLGPEDIEETAALHDEVANGLSRDIFAASPYEEIERFLGSEGLAVGIRHKGKLVTARTVKMGRGWTEEAVKSFEIELDGDEFPAVTGFCVVDWEFRGNNVQYLTQYLVEDIVAREHTSLLTTVSPKNIFSLENILTCNFRIIGIKEVYGGYLRFILKKDFRSSLLPIWTHGHLQIPIRDKAAQMKAIAEGYAGYKLVRKHKSGFHILYARAAEA